MHTLRVSIHDKRFVTTGNPRRVSGTDTVFHYRTDGPVITGPYTGGRSGEESHYVELRDESTV